MPGKVCEHPILNIPSENSSFANRIAVFARIEPPPHIPPKEEWPLFPVPDDLFEVVFEELFLAHIYNMFIIIIICPII